MGDGLLLLVAAVAAGMLELDGLTRISEDVGDWLRGRQSPAIQVVQART